MAYQTINLWTDFNELIVDELVSMRPYLDGTFFDYSEIDLSLLKQGENDYLSMFWIHYD